MGGRDIIEAAALLTALLGAAAGCGDDSSTGPTTTTTGTGPVGGGAPGCRPGELELDDGSCVPAGVPADLPPPGPAEPVEAGIPADQCADGFEPTGDGGCDPILPTAPCGPGTMAVPGETACHEIAVCGDDTWGDIPIDLDAEHFHWPARFDDLGGNVCGCAGQIVPCAVQSTNLTPPAPPP